MVWQARDNWNRVAQFLTPHYHVIIPDLPNSGDTKTPSNFDNSVRNVTSQLRQFIEAIDCEENLHVAGHSLGGSIATVYASQYPFDTQSLFYSIVQAFINLLIRLTPKSIIFK